MSFHSFIHSLMFRMSICVPFAMLSFCHFTEINAYLNFSWCLAKMVEKQNRTPAHCVYFYFYILFCLCSILPGLMAQASRMTSKI
uniref:Uncharacterized protein n=1 Tax=Anguilla anguilla TaxID=7936 RepID=A0A0E9QA90_ANGAN